MNLFRIALSLCVLFSLISCDRGIDEELRRAAIKDQADQVKVLISSGADVNFRHGGWTVLMFVAREGHCNIAATLIENGADPNAKGWQGETALTISAERGHTEVTKVLLSKGAT